MDQLIEALQIFLKYDKPAFPIQCEHDQLYICGNYDPEKMEDADVKKLDELGFFWSDSDDLFISFKYGSA